MQRRALLSSVAVGATAVLSGCLDEFAGDRSRETRELSFDAPRETPVHVETRNGDVTVESSDGSSLDVTAELSAPGEHRFETVSVTGEKVEERFEVAATYAEEANRVRVDLQVEVPEGVAVSSVQTENGDVTVTGVDGPVAFDTRNGDVDVTDVAGVSGARSENGDVDVELPAPLPGDVDVASTNGVVHAAVSPDVDAALDARTENGDATVDGLGFDDASGGEDGEPAQVSGTLGDGTHEVSVTTRNGDVELSALE